MKHLLRAFAVAAIVMAWTSTATATPPDAGTEHPAKAQQAKAADNDGGTPKTSAAVSAQEQDEDLEIDKIEHDYTVVNLPTTVRLPRHKSAFRITHRFSRALDEDDFGDLAESLFGLDSGAVIGLEYRYGLASGTQLAVHRSTDAGARTIQFILQHNFWKQGEDGSLGLDAFVSVEGQNHLRRDYSEALGVIFSHKMGDRFAGYLQPIVVLNPNRVGVSDEDPVLMLGIGARVRLTNTMYLVGEAAPRVFGIDGYNRGVDHGAVAVEWRVGGHAFQLNFSNSFGTTMAQMARGGPASRGWHIGFNITRKFF